MKTTNASITLRFVTIAALAALSLGAACSSAERSGEPEKGTNLPTPYTAKQIRDAMPVGSKISLRNEDAKGKVTVDEIEVTAATPEKVTVSTKVFDEQEKLIEDRGETTSTWEELRDHALFPADKAVRSEGTITVPVGEHNTWLYVVTGTDADGNETQTYFHFAKDLPGPPVRKVINVDGKAVFNMTMVGRR